MLLGERPVSLPLQCLPIERLEIVYSVTAPADERNDQTDEPEDHHERRPSDAEVASGTEGQNAEENLEHRDDEPLAEEVQARNVEAEQDLDDRHEEECGRGNDHQEVLVKVRVDPPLVLGLAAAANVPGSGVAKHDNVRGSGDNVGNRCANADNDQKGTGNGSTHRYEVMTNRRLRNFLGP